MLTYAEWEGVHNALSLMISLARSEGDEDTQDLKDVIALQTKVQAILKQMLADDVVNQGR